MTNAGLFGLIDFICSSQEHEPLAVYQSKYLGMKEKVDGPRSKRTIVVVEVNLHVYSRSVVVIVRMKNNVGRCSSLEGEILQCVGDEVMSLVDG